MWENVWPVVVAVADLVIAVVASAHVILRKRDVRAAIGWVGLIWLVPVAGTLLYLVAGVNRIQRRGRRIQEELQLLLKSRETAVPPGAEQREPTGMPAELTGLARAVSGVTGLPLLGGNRIAPMEDGDEAFPAMLEAIRAAESTVMFSTYIFEFDDAGREFVTAFEEAVRRGVAVRVLVDGVGDRYGKPRVTGILRNRGVPVAQFLGSVAPWKARYFNLRNHRKILVVDGRIGFTGGMNVREGHFRGSSPRKRVRDLHFRLEGPVVRHLAEAFAKDWVFATGELLYSPGWFPALEPCGDVTARGIPDGPDDDFERLHWALLAALARAEDSVRIVTPYFLPDPALTAALNVAALRGVTVDVVLPERNNLAVVGWAMASQLPQILEMGCRVWLSPPPFDHTKILVVDGAWSLFGSGNWDPRSLRLNFEFNVEAYDRAFAAALESRVRERIEAGRQLTLDELRVRSLPVRLRDGVAWLASPYL